LPGSIKLERTARREQAYRMYARTPQGAEGALPVAAQARAAGRDRVTARRVSWTRLLSPRSPTRRGI